MHLGFMEIVMTNGGIKQSIYKRRDVPGLINLADLTDEIKREGGIVTTG